MNFETGGASQISDSELESWLVGVQWVTRMTVLQRSSPLPEQSMAGTRIIFNTFPMIPSPDSSLTDSAVLISGSSFKPLRLSSHPWVRAHLRHASRDPQKPRLSFLAQHHHMYGPESFSQPDAATRVVSGEGIRRGRNNLQEVPGNSGQIPGRLPGVNDRVSDTPGQARLTSASDDALQDPLLGQSRRRLHIRPDCHSMSEGRPPMVRSVSAPGRVASPPSETLDQGTTRSTRLSHKTISHRKRHMDPPPLGIAAFSSAFVSVLSTSDNIFGYYGPTNDQPSKERHTQTAALKFKTPG